jgi:hypothetical protein
LLIPKYWWITASLTKLGGSCVMRTTPFSRCKFAAMLQRQRDILLDRQDGHLFAMQLAPMISHLRDHARHQPRSAHQQDDLGSSIIARAIASIAARRECTPATRRSANTGKYS